MYKSFLRMLRKNMRIVFLSVSNLFHAYFGKCDKFCIEKGQFETNWSFHTELSKFDEIISKKGNLKQTGCSGRSISLNHNT